MLLTMAQISLNTTCGYAASGVALGSAVVAGVAPESAADGAMALGYASVAAAALTQFGGFLKGYWEDRKDRRAGEMRVMEQDLRVVDLANKLNHNTARMEALEGVEKVAADLRRKYQDLEAEYKRLQREVNAELRAGLDKGNQGIKMNTAGVVAILESWGSKTPPTMPDRSEPLSHPEFDPLPDVPNPIAAKSRNDISIPEEIRDVPPP